MRSNFFWSMMENSSLYTPLLVLEAPWKDVSLDFVVGLQRMQRNKDSIMVIMDKFSRMAHYVPCNKTANALISKLMNSKSIVRKTHILNLTIN